MKLWLKVPLILYTDMELKSREGKRHIQGPTRRLWNCHTLLVFLQRKDFILKIQDKKKKKNRRQLYLRKGISESRMILEQASGVT